MKKKILYLINEDWFFCSHFLDRAKAAHQSGYDVVVVTRVRAHQRDIIDSGLRLIPFQNDRRSVNPFSELRRLWRLISIYHQERPTLCHHIALKSVLLGTIAAKITNVTAIVNAPVGLGYVFSSNNKITYLLRPFVRFALKLFLNPNNSKVIFENFDDMEYFCKKNYVRRDRSILIRGAGIDLEKFRPVPEPFGKPVILLAARMLYDKGVREFVEAATLLRNQGIDACFKLVGGLDPDNRAAIPEAVLNDWVAQGLVEWLGHRTDIAQQLATCHIVCLPSYREGLPKFLLEAAASSRPIVTTDVPGCREVVLHGDNGLLVPPRDAIHLSKALKILIESEVLRAKMGERGRRRSESEFSNNKVITETLCVYQQSLEVIN
ncbi:glycosyltransferase family 4 protein [Thalassospira profundimaris]|uniref:glycosyltransferase family 4 protein n=1 Tax=Thalassospira profundimaris TaxID=502049 RepID=UPI000287223B|nr:glycosyltransferase family 4 protein [Thalassospira profundimaris]EKF09237.1 alpha-D-QuiNAc alpha-1,3-galactosyltransferase [Thalassospira profundimaris WP0211]